MNTTRMLRTRYLLTGARAEVIEDGAIVWQDGTILSSGPYEELRKHYKDTPCTVFRDHLVTPGLINAHDHGRGLGTLQMGVRDAPLEIWISGLFALRALDPYLAALYDGLNLLASGVTTTTHQHNPCDWLNLEQELLDTARGYRDAGIRACIGVPLMDQNTLSYIGTEGFLKGLPGGLADALRKAGFGGPMPPASGMIAVGRSLARTWKDNSRHWLSWGPVGPQWCSDHLLQEIADTAGESPIHIHTVETRTQRAYGERIYGRTPIAHLRHIGFLQQNVTCAHCVWLSEQDIDALGEAGAKVAHNPSSNLRLQSGIASVLQLINKGISVGLGLDGQAINDDQDMWLEMRLAKGLAVEPGAAGRCLAARDILAMATTTGASITGGPVRGELSSGSAADLIAVKLDRIRGPYLDSRTDLIEAVFGRAKPMDVDTVIVAGKTSIEAGEPTGVELNDVRERLAAFLSPSKSAMQLAREELAAQIGPHLRNLYSGW